ncbi:hypothetical protein [Methylobacterium sp. J-068]|uniref:hypothetical protein n=1 Tax=Methylobacterium sp. J-068 TaxID=2836649 RepID=UPI001FBB48AE|nr:hypothetical protein [Methylobacterium sp. J-068]MCJ2033109.1 hypothetical protein [Methylobacterium sp. J-068]
MTQAALRIVDDEFDTSIVRRLMARPLRVVAEVAPTGSEPEAASVAATELSRLKAEVMVMKAVLGAERRESERLRACLTRMDDPETLSPEARAVRDRWAALVDLILQAPH